MLLLVRGKRVLLLPVLEREAVSDKQHPSECSLCDTSKRVLWLILPVLGAFVTFHAMKSKERKTTKRINDKSVKVKSCGKIYWAGRPRPFYVVFQIIGSCFCLFDIKNQTISFFMSFLKAYNTSAEEFFDL